MGFDFKSKPSTPVRGGSGKMLGKTGANPAKATAFANKGGMSKGMIKGGKGKMAGFTGVKPAKKC
jgi:hypothetical protein